MKKPTGLRALKEGLSKKYTATSVGPASEVRPANIKRLTTGSLMLDYAMGGGIPIGRVTMFYGMESSGKSTASYRAMGNAQDLCSHCWRPAQIHDVVQDAATGEWRAVGLCDCVKKGLYKPEQFEGESEKDFTKRCIDLQKNSYRETICCLVDVEGSLESEWAETVGLDVRRLFMVIPSSAEEGIDIACALLRSGDIHVMCLDSIAALTPTKELEESTESWQMGLQARLVNKFCRIVGINLNAVFAEQKWAPTVLLINQVRQKIGGYGDGDVLPGGNGQNFLLSVKVKFWSSQFKEDDGPEFNSSVDKDEKVKRPGTVRTNFKVIKNKTASPRAQSSFVMGLTNDDKGRILDEDVMIDAGLKLKLIVKDSNGLSYGTHTFKSARAMSTWLAENFEDKRAMRARLVEKMLSDE